MKKFLVILSVLAISVIAFSCGNKSNSPSATVEKYWQAIESSDYEAAINCIQIPEEQKTQLLSVMKEKLPESLEENGGFESMKVTSEQIAEDGQSATVSAEVVYADSTETQDFNLVLVDGQWLISLGDK